MADADWPTRFVLLETHLLQRAHASRGAPLVPELAEAWRRICATAGSVRVQLLAGHVGWSRRHLTSRFTAEFGLSPKQAAMVARFERANQLAQQGRPLADIAATTGYADQAHLNRDWRTLAGQTPTEHSQTSQSSKPARTEPSHSVSMNQTQLYACLTYRDADRAIEFVRALGFTERLVVRDPDDASIVVHSQFQWRETGGVMLGSFRPEDDRGFTMTPGATTINLVVASDDEVDATLARAVEAGATIAQEPHHPPHGGRTCMVRDAEGNLWNIDSYSGE